MATSAGYTATATGTDYWVATYNGDSNNAAVTSGTALEPVTITPATPAINTSQQPASATVGTLDRRPGHGERRVQPDRHRHVQPVQQLDRHRHAAVHRRREPLVSGVATSAGYTATATGTDYWVATYNGDSNNASVTSGTALEPVTITPATPAINTSQQPASATVGTLDRRPGHGQRRVQPDRHRDVQPVQQLDRQRHAPVHRRQRRRW